MPNTLARMEPSTAPRQHDIGQTFTRKQFMTWNKDKLSITAKLLAHLMREREGGEIAKKLSSLAPRPGNTRSVKPSQENQMLL